MTSPPLPPPAAPPAASPRPAKTSPWLKALFGCAIGCGALAILAFLAAGAGFWWLVTPGEQIATEAVAGGESVGVIHLRGLNEDPGTRELLARAWLEMQRAADRARAEEVPEPLRWLEEIGRAQTGSSGLTMWIPREITVAVERGADGEHVFVIALNMSTFPRLVRAVVRRAARAAEDEGGMARERHRGYEIEVFPEGGALSFAGSTLLFASERAALRRALDRLEDGPEPGPMAALLPVGAGDRWDVHVVLLDDGGLGESFAERLAPGSGPAPPIERMIVGIDFATGDRIVGEVRLDCASAADAREWLDRLERAFERLEVEQGRGALAAAVAGTVADSGLRAEVELSGIGGWIERLIDEGMAERPPGGVSN